MPCNWSYFDVQKTEINMGVFYFRLRRFFISCKDPWKTNVEWILGLVNWLKKKLLMAVCCVFMPIYCFGCHPFSELIFILPPVTGLASLQLLMCFPKVEKGKIRWLREFWDVWLSLWNAATVRLPAGVPSHLKEWEWSSTIKISRTEVERKMYS